MFLFLVPIDLSILTETNEKKVNSPLSIAAVIAFSLILLVIILAITIGIILLRRKPSQSSSGSSTISSTSSTNKQRIDDHHPVEVVDNKYEVQGNSVC